MMKSLCIVAVLVAVVAGVFGDAPVCTKLSVCSCKTDSGNIDLTPLPKVLKVNDDKGVHEYQYSPCTDNGGCQNATVCMTEVTGKVATIGKSSGETFTTKNGEVAIEYPGDNNKTSVVILKCDQSKDGELTVIDDSSDVFTFQLDSKYACVGGPVTSKTTTSKTTKTTPKTTPKTTKTTPKTSPKTTKTTPKTSPKTTKTTPKTTKTSPKSPKTSPKSTKTTPKGGKTTKTTPKGGKTTKTTPKGGKTTKTTPKGGKTTNTTPHMTTPGKAASNSSIGFAVLTLFVLMCRQMFQ